MPYPEEYYLAARSRYRSAEHLTWQIEIEATAGRAERIIGKQRHGPTGQVQGRFDRKVTRLNDWANRPEPWDNCA